VGFRCSPHPVAGALARRLEAVGAGPVTATSLNRSGRPPARDREDALRECGRARAGAVGAPSARCDGASAPWLLDAGPDAGGGAPSSVVDLTGDAPVILREGPVDAAAIEAVLRGHGAHA
jgi:tRNA A37 threonylcarbamoyladenosine synthetase subunit TsaC/SUA5/YrdC